MPPKFVIPDFVMLYLNKGGKFVMDKHHCALQDVLIGMDQMALKLHKAKFFADRPDLASKRKKSAIAISSVWHPPLDMEISAFLRHLRRDVVSSFVDSPLRRNYIWLDCKAIQWLKQHKSEIVIADADKGLGDVLLPRSWVSAELDRLLHTGFRRLSETEYVSATFDARLHDGIGNSSNGSLWGYLQFASQVYLQWSIFQARRFFSSHCQASQVPYGRPPDFQPFT